MNVNLCFSCITLLATSLISGPSLAGTMGEIPHSSSVISISSGPVWSNSGKAETFYLAPEIEKTYTTNHAHNTLADGELFIGIQHNLPKELQARFGFAVAATSNAKLKGEIWDDADPQFNNYTYQYSLQHNHVALKGIILADRGYMLVPFINASVGVAFNRATHFTNTPTIFEAVVNPNFESHTKSSFTYTVGAGVQHKFTQHLEMGIGYEFADWGQSRLNPAAGQTLNSGLYLSHYYTNGFLVNLTYLA